MDRYTRAAAFDVRSGLFFFLRADRRSIRSLSLGLSGSFLCVFLFEARFFEVNGPVVILFGENRLGTAVDGRTSFRAPPFSPTEESTRDPLILLLRPLWWFVAVLDWLLAAAAARAAFFL